MIKKRVSGAIQVLVNAKEFNLNCTRVSQENMLIPTRMYENKTMVPKERESSRIKRITSDQ